MKKINKISLNDIPKDIQMNMPEGGDDVLFNSIMNATTNSILEKLKGSESVFETPVNYFTELENDIFAQTNNQDLEPSFVQKWQERFQHIKNQEFYLTPDRYFDFLPAQIQNAILKHKSQSPVEVLLSNLQAFILKPIPAFAVIVCLITGASFWFKTIEKPIVNEVAITEKPQTVTTPHKVEKVNLDNISKKEIADYLAMQDNIPTEIEELASKSKIKTTDIFKEKDIKVDQNTIEENISSEEIEELTLEEL